MSKRPIVWVSGPDKGGTAAWWATWFSIRRSGGRAVRVTPSRRDRIARKSPQGAPHALILGGGADIDPGRYEDLITDLKNIRTSPDLNEPKGQRWVTLVLAPLFVLLRKAFSAGAIAVDQARDDMEWILLQQAVQQGIPVLGICRGAQLINVFHNGTLYQDLATYYRERPKITTIYPRKVVRLEPGSRLREIFGEQNIRVNSLHNQAVKRPGEHIRVVAREMPFVRNDDNDGERAQFGNGRKQKAGTGEIDRKPVEKSVEYSKTGVAQAIEHSGYPFMIGVQWHPEYLPQVPSQRQLFDQLVQYAILRRDAGSDQQTENGTSTKKKSEDVTDE